MFCPNCGSQVADQTRFCGNCGTALAGGTGSAGGAPPAQNAQSMAGPTLPAVPRKRGMPGWAIALIVIAVIVVAVPIILIAVVLPTSVHAYGNYLVRSQVSEGAMLADGAKVAVTEYHSNMGGWPNSNADAGLPNADSIHGKYASSVQLEPGTGDVVVTYSSNAPYAADSSLDGKQLVLVPQATPDGTVTWSCGGPRTTVPEQDLPSACR